MTERERLIEKWKVASHRGQRDIAGTYFQAALEAGAKELDEKVPGAGDPWRAIGKSVAAFTAAHGQGREDGK